MPITFTREESSTFAQSGECDTTYGHIEWQNEAGSWDGRWGSPQPVEDLVALMKSSGPFSRTQYRIIEAKLPELVIKPTCAGCGMIAGIDCQRTCEYIFGRADVTESLPIQFNDKHQFNLSVAVTIDGKNFGAKKSKNFTFNSVRCAELFLMEHGVKANCKKGAVIGSGERLLAYLGGVEVVKARKNRRSLEYKQAQMSKRVQLPSATGPEQLPTC